MATPLTDSINALTTYANEVTRASDTTLSDAVHTLASGYGGSATLITKTITENGTYLAADDSADGYSSVTVNVPTGGTTTPYYMWMDSNSYVHISTTEHNGYQINVSSVEEHSIWSTVYEATISEWTQVNNCYEYEASVTINIDDSITFRVTYDGITYTLQSVEGLIGSDVYGWDGTRAVDYPFGIMSGGDVIWIDVITNGTHTIKIERWG